MHEGHQGEAPRSVIGLDPVRFRQGLHRFYFWNVVQWQAQILPIGSPQQRHIYSEFSGSTGHRVFKGDHSLTRRKAAVRGK